MTADPDVGALLEGLRSGSRRDLARAITLLESTRPDHLPLKARLLDGLEHGMVEPATVRLGISGTPGVGKSTLIEAVGQDLLLRGHRVAVLAVDPSSKRSRGSILGDKTRMPALAGAPGAFIRPSPSGAGIGGITGSTAAAVAVCEAAGFNVVLVETVGVGQSDTAVADVTDLFLLLHAPGGGDELQGIKRGVMELADRVAVTKADGDLRPAAVRAAAELTSALHLMRPKPGRGQTPVDLVSAKLGTGVNDLIDALLSQHVALNASGELTRLRETQRLAQLWRSFDEGLRRRSADGPAFERALEKATAAVRTGRRSPLSAALDLLAAAGRPATEINAVTLAVADMNRSVAFYRAVGMPLVFQADDDSFVTLSHGQNFVNLQFDPAHSPPHIWGRIVLWVPDPDEIHGRLTTAGYTTETEPADASWGERYFHVRDPDGHELSFARKL